MDLMSTISGSLLEGFFPAGWDLKKIDACVDDDPSSFIKPQKWWHKGFEPVPCKTLADFAKALKVFDEGPLPVNAADKLPGDFIASTFDFGDERELLLGVDLSPGTYVLIAQDSDGDAPDVPVEQIEITVS